ncbi:tetratricopeptide repeat protein [Streptomyces sp. MUM 203J]|uniref:P-loop NTPase n=1 Tax=Streptomyces sp. MUM 203J TaxID=2791990 RepID=UPI001F03DF40|nr:tetratricopeptide repeat protein [Streptomyces sp. MUM 203J]MCH0542101.1 tetratricopeptide repeat protein [Streptomyces sp. MUM 203J]
MRTPTDGRIHWPPWPAEEDPAELARYALPGTVARHVRIPGPSGESAVTRLRAVWQRLSEQDIGYAYEPAGSGEAGQLIRPPAEVLVAPRNGTCLDLALVLAAACEHAGLPSTVVVVERVAPRPARHALVAVALAGTWPAGWDEALPGEPPGAAAAVRRTLAQQRPVVVLDPVGPARSLGTGGTAGTEASVEEGTESGWRYLTAPEWQWRTGAPVAAARDRYRPAPLPNVLPLRDVHRDPGTAESPLRLVRPEYRLTPFQARDELTVLTDLCERIAEGSRTGIVVLHGAGGAGKTRLALETAVWLKNRGWYAGPLREGMAQTDPTALAWLAEVTAPLAVVVDYADARVEETTALLRVLQDRQGPPAVVLLTSRTGHEDTARGRETAEWLQRVFDSLIADRHPFHSEMLALPDLHPRGTDVFTATVERLVPPGGHTAPPPPGPPDPAPGTTWTTLDLVLLGLLAARGTGHLPDLRPDLYDEILRHEQKYWSHSHLELFGTRAPRPLLQTAAACLTLLAPPPEEAPDTLAAVPGLDGPDRAHERDRLARTLLHCLDPGPGERTAVRPDPVGDHLMLTVLEHDLSARSGPDGSLLERSLSRADGPRLAGALGTLNRAGQDRPGPATALIATAVLHRPERWRTAVEVAALSGGAVKQALEAVVPDLGTSLPLEELSAELPPLRLGLTALARQIDELRLGEALSDGAGPAETAALLTRVSQRQADDGDVPAALRTMARAVRLHRALAATGPRARRDELAAALNDLSVRYAQAGDRRGALRAAAEAVGLHREAEPEAGEPLDRFATALNSLAAWSSEAGLHRQALQSAEEAVGLYRRLYAADPDAHRPGLAGALGNLAAARLDLGRRGAALEAAEESAGLYRHEAAVSPAGFAPEAADALANLAIVRSRAGDPAGAAAVAAEAVRLRRRFTAQNPRALVPGLVRALWTLALRAREAGDLPTSLEAAEEAVALCRPLAGELPDMFVPDLAGALVTLSGVCDAAGDGGGASAAAYEAVELYRPLAAQEPAAFTDGLAAALNSLANARATAGDGSGASAAAQEALDLCRRLYAADPDAHRPGLAGALVTVAGTRSAAQDTAGASAAAGQAVELYRRLAAEEPEAHTADLALALNNLGIAEGARGHAAEALNAFEQAHSIRRSLAEQDAAAHGDTLARTLNNLADARLTAGDAAGALAPAHEAVRLFRDPPGGGPAAYRAELATALGTLATAHRATGDLKAAVSALTEATELRRARTATGHGHSGALAGTLNDMAVLRLEADDPHGALAAAREAAELLRAPADRNPATGLRALVLNTLAVCAARAGRSAEALAAAEEAVALHRATSPEGPLGASDRMAALNSLSGVRAETGDVPGAAEAAEETLGLARQLAGEQPQSFLPSLAMALGNAARRRSAAGDRRGARRAAAEAVRVGRWLAAARPDRFTADLARATDLLAGLRPAPVRGPLAAAAWWRSARAVPDPVHRAEVRAAAARWYAGRGQYAAATRALLEACEATAADDGTGHTALAAARRAVRSAALEILPPHARPLLPPWAMADVLEEDARLVRAWRTAGDWPRARAVLLDSAAAVTGGTLRAGLRTLAALHPGDTTLTELSDLLSRVERDGLAETVAALDDQHRRRSLTEEWTGATDWTESFSYLARNLRELLEPGVTEYLEQSDEPTAPRHLAILGLLADGTHLTAVQSIVTRANHAADHALAALERGETHMVRTVAEANPDALDTPGAGPLLRAVLHLADGERERAVAALRGEAENGAGELRHRARLVSLRRFAAAAVTPPPLARSAAELAEALTVREPAAPETTPRAA